VTCSSNSTVHQSRAMMTTREAPGVAPKRRRAAQRPRNFAARKVRGRGLEPDGDARQGWIFQGFSSADIRSRSLNGSIALMTPRRRRSPLSRSSRVARRRPRRLHRLRRGARRAGESLGRRAPRVVGAGGGALRVSRLHRRVARRAVAGVRGAGLTFGALVHSGGSPRRSRAQGDRVGGQFFSSSRRKPGNETVSEPPLDDR
jgi:hypothetical protein